VLERNVHWLFVIWERNPKSGIIVFLTKALDKASDEASDEGSDEAYDEASDEAYDEASDEASDEGHSPRTGCDGGSETIYQCFACKPDNCANPF
jgi:hypothetical protein